MIFILAIKNQTPAITVTDIQEGRAEGLQKGRAEATTRLNKLYSCLLTSDRADDLQRALKDPVYLEQLLQEFGF